MTLRPTLEQSHFPHYWQHIFMKNTADCKTAGACEVMSPHCQDAIEVKLNWIRLFGKIVVSQASVNDQ